MATQQGTLIAALYASEERATEMLDEIKRMSHADTITIVDAAVLVKDQDGKIHVRETKELTARKGARRGAVITGLVSVFFPAGLIASAVVGGIGGAVVGKLKDSGIKNETIKGIGDQIGVGQAAVLVLVEEEDSIAGAQNALSADEAELIVQPIDDATMKELYLAHHNVPE
ncbi:MAG TPA: DUF1269 domain-containing protein [Thermomicrobiales bacterium]|nr:DUF1269 domain-containing protein [Thermomicrobiales bacterium]